MSKGKRSDAPAPTPILCTEEVSRDVGVDQPPAHVLRRRPRNLSRRSAISCCNNADGAPVRRKRRHEHELVHQAEDLRHRIRNASKLILRYRYRKR